MTTSRSDLSRKVVFTDTGDPAGGAYAYFFVANSTTPLVVFQEPSGSVPHTHPVVASAAGRFPSIYVPYGDHRQRVTTASGVLLWDDDYIPNPEPVTSSGGSVDPDLLKETGDIIIRFQTGSKAGYVRLNGRTIGNASSGATERANDDCEALYLHLWAALADAEAPVSGGRGASAAADWAAGKPLKLPSGQFKSFFGLAGMGATAFVPNAAVTIAAGKSDTPGAPLGADAHTLSLAQMPAHNHGGATGSAAPTNPTYFNDASTWPVATGPNATAIIASASSTSTSGDLTHAHSIASAGSGAAHNNMPPGLLVTFYIKL